MDKKTTINCICIIEDCVDLIAKEIESELIPNKLLIDYIKSRLDLILEYKGE